MKFIVNTNQLLHKLQSVSGTIVSKPVIPILDHFLFDITDKNGVVVVAKDKRITVKHIREIDKIK